MIVLLNSKSPRQRIAFLWLPVVVWAVLIAVGTSTPGNKLPRSPFPHFDLVVHFGMYGVLAFLLYRALQLGTRLGAGRPTWLIAFAIAQVYGILDEIHQIWIPNRSCDPVDALTDGIGAAVGVCLFYWLWKKARSVDNARRNGGTGEWENRQ